MHVKCHSTWLLEDDAQGLNSILRVGNCDASLDAAFVKVCRQGSDVPCTLVLCGAQQQGYDSLVLLSSSRLCEVLVERHGDAAPSYVTTVKAQQTAGGEWYRAVVPLKGLPTHDTLHVRLLSLKGDKDTCKLQSLAFLDIQQQPQQQPVGAVNITYGGSTVDSGSAPPSVLLSQMDELRLLNDCLANAGSQSRDSVVPDSLKLLMDKAMQEASSASATSASARALSAHVAQGAILRHRAQLQRPQDATTSGLRAASTAAGPQSVGHLTSAAEAHVTSNSWSSAPTEAQQTAGCQVAVLQAITRMESKLDSFVERVTAAMQRFEDRLTALEAGCIAPSRLQDSS